MSVPPFYVDLVNIEHVCFEKNQNIFVVLIWEVNNHNQYTGTYHSVNKLAGLTSAFQGRIQCTTPPLKIR